MKVTSEQLSGWPKEVEVISNIPLKVCHEEMTIKISWQVIHLKIRSNHGEKSPVCVLCLIRKETNHAWQVDTTKESHENKDLENNNVIYIYVEVKKVSIPDRTVLGIS